MDYKMYVEVVNIEDIIEEPTVEPSESYNNLTTISINTQDNDNYSDSILIIILSSISSLLFILFLLWFKYIRIKNNIKKNQLQRISIKNNYIKSAKEDLDCEFGTMYILDDICMYIS
jgi:ATP-dependent Zn protease